MNGKISFGAALFGGALGSFVSGAFKAVLDALGMAPFEKAIALAVARSQEGQLPVNHDLDNALRIALGQATRVLAYHLHEPSRKSLGELLQNFSDWPNLVHRLLEIGQNNLIAGPPADHWLATLIEKSKNPDNFNDLPLDLVLADHQLTRLLSDQTDQTVKQAINDRFLAWVDRHVPDNGGKPKDFAASVANGWPVGKDGARLSFYDVVCVFFREQLKDGDKVFRAFTANVLTGLKGDLAEIRSALPDPATLQRFTDTLAAFEDKEFDANYTRFKQHLKRQNDQVLNLLRQEFAGVHAHLDRQEGAAERRHQETAVGQSWLRRRLGWVVAGVGLVLAVVLALGWQQQVSLAKLDALVKRDAPGSELLRQFRQRLDAARFGMANTAPEGQVTAALTELARDRNLTVDALRQRLLQAASNAEERLSLSGQLRRGAEQETRRLREIEREAHIEVADSVDFGERPQEALQHYQQALELTDRATNPRRWADIQLRLAFAHRCQSVSSDESALQEHSRSAVLASRSALEVFTRGELPREWALAQYRLGDALDMQASASGCEELERERIWGEATTAFRAALEALSGESFAQEWASVQVGLAQVLQSQWSNHGRGRDKDEAIRLLGDAVSCYRAAAAVYDRAGLREILASTQAAMGDVLHDLSRQTSGVETDRLLSESAIAYRTALDADHSAYGQAHVHESLARVLVDQGKRKEGADGVRLLAQAVAELRVAVKHYTQMGWSDSLAQVQDHLGFVLLQQAKRSEATSAMRLQDEAEAAFRASLQIDDPTCWRWGNTQINLGSALQDHALQSQGAEVVRLLTESATAYRAALTVITREESPWQWAKTENNLGNALSTLADRAEGGEAVRLLAEAVIAYRNALTAFTREGDSNYRDLFGRDFPVEWHEVVSGNLSAAETSLAKLRGESAAP